jgi:hypothetical protein
VWIAVGAAILLVAAVTRASAVPSGGTGSPHATRS